jgi:hypothetical protein
MKQEIWETFAYTNPPSVLKYQPGLTANLSTAAGLSNLALFCQKHLAHCGCAKAGSWPE